MRLDASKYSLAHDGVTRFAGLTSDPELLRQRSGSFHEVQSVVPPEWHAAFDTVVVSDATGAGFGLHEALRCAWACLVEGGTVLAEVQRSEAGISGAPSLESWLHNLEFHCTHTHSRGNGNTLVIARKRTRRLRNIATEVCDRLQVPGITAEAVARLLGEDL
jgi:hypothetical protein